MVPLNEESHMKNITRVGVASLCSLTAAVALGTVGAQPAQAAVFKVDQHVTPGTSVRSGTAVSIKYSWPGGGAEVTTQWGNRGTEVHRTPNNTRTVTRTLTTCHRSERINVATTVKKGTNDIGHAAIAIFVSNTTGPWCD
jgi:hypothetical protein